MNLASIFSRKPRKRTMTDIIMSVFFALLFGGLGVMLLVVGTREHFMQRRLLAAAVPVEATILSSEIRTSTSSNSTSSSGRSTTTTSHLSR